MQALALRAGEKETTLMDRPAVEARKREENDKEVMQLREELKRNAEELHVLKTGSDNQRRAMEKALEDAKSAQDQHNALKAHVLTVARAVLHKFGVLTFLGISYLERPLCDIKRVVDCR